MKIRTCILFVTVAFVCATAPPSPAAVVEADLGFSAQNQSLWGWGTSPDIQYADSLDLWLVEFSWDFGASPGTVDANFNGRVSADYAPQLASPGSTPVTLGFTGDPGGGRWNSDLGVWAWFGVTAAGFGPYALLDENYALRPDTGAFTPVLGAGAGASDEMRVEVPAYQIPVVATVGAGFNVIQASTFQALGITGTMNYRLEGDSVVHQTPFEITAGGFTATADLNQAGTWDFWLSDLNLANRFSSDFDLELFLYETHVDPTEIVWCKKWGFLWYPCGFGTDTNTLEFPPIDLFSVDPFALAFNEIDFADPMFSIQVAGAPVPEPGTMILLGSGLAALARFRRAKPAR